MKYTQLSKANANTLADYFQALALGRLLIGQIPQVRRRVDLSANSPYNLATLGSLVLPDEAKASSIIRATAIAGTAAAGELTIVGFGATPATTQIAVAPNGDIVGLLADAYTSVDITYIPERGFSVQSFFPVVTNVLTLPTGWTGTGHGVALVTEVEAITATATGKKIILVPGAGAPVAGQCRLNLAKGTITFAGADAVTRARVKGLRIEESADLNTVLQGTNDTL